MRTEHAANLALSEAAARKPAAWAKPSTCRRPARPSLFRRLLNLFA